MQPPPDAAALIEDLAADGFSKFGVARRMGVARETLSRWLDEHPELQDAFDTGREKERYALHNMLYRLAVEEKDKIAAIFLLKSRFGYREGDQGDQGNRVSINFTLPGAMKPEAFIVENEPSTRAE
jgi:hypothetical protein